MREIKSRGNQSLPVALTGYDFSPFRTPSSMISSIYKKTWSNWCKIPKDLSNDYLSLWLHVLSVDAFRHERKVSSDQIKVIYECHEPMFEPHGIICQQNPNIIQEHIFILICYSRTNYILFDITMCILEL